MSKSARQTAADDTFAWMGRALDLADLCAVSGACEEAGRLAEAHALLSASDKPASLPIGDVPERARLDRTIAAGGTLDAALALLGPGAGYMLSCPPAGGQAMATVVMPGLRREETAQGETPALALLGAHLCALLALLHSGQAAPLGEAHGAGARLN